jgi:LCP family protein required for cell wall assembly
MSELRPRSELRSSGELRPRSSGSPKVPGIARHGRLRKQSPLGAIFGFIAAALAVILVSGGSIAAVAFNALYSKTEIVELIGETEGPPPQIGAIEGGFNILIVGSDTCEEAMGNCGDRENELNDVNILLHVSQDQSNAVAISFPRDMVVGIPECPWSDGDGVKGYSTEALNTAMYYGGLNCVAMTISELTGLPIQFAGKITFNGVIQMSNAIGGVDVCIDAPIYDTYTGLNLPTAGTHTLTGFDALAFLRSRHGVGDGSDLTRISSQQVYLSSLVRKLQADGTLSNPSVLYNLATAALGNMTLSSNLADVPTMVSIALALKDIPLERVTFVQYPGSTGGSGIYAGKVRPNVALGDQMMELVRADQPFALAQAGDGSGSQEVAPPPVTNVKTPIDLTNPDPEPTETAAPVPVDNSGLPVLSGIRGQTAANYTCSISNE